MPTALGLNLREIFHESFKSGIIIEAESYRTLEDAQEACLENIFCEGVSYVISLDTYEIRSGVPRKKLFTDSWIKPGRRCYENRVDKNGNVLINDFYLQAKYPEIKSSRYVSGKFLINKSFEKNIKIILKIIS